MGYLGGGQAHAPGRVPSRATARAAESATLPRVTPSPESGDLLGGPLPDLTLPDTHGADYRLRQFVGSRPLVLFFYVLNGTPG